MTSEQLPPSAFAFPDALKTQADPRQTSPAIGTVPVSTVQADAPAQHPAAGHAEHSEPALPQPDPAPATPTFALPQPAANVSAAQQAPATAPVHTADAYSHAAEPIATALSQLRSSSNGEHRLTVQLHPADLGPVTVVAHLDNDSLSVSLAASAGAGRDALQAALPQLQANLQQAGFAAVSLALDAGDTAGQGAPQQHQSTPLATPPTPSAPADREPSRPMTTARRSTIAGLDRWL